MFFVRSCDTAAAGEFTLAVCPAPAGGGMTAVAVRDLASGADSCMMVGCGTPTPIGRTSQTPGVRVLVVERTDRVTVTGHYGP